jgi:cobalt-zinc-cadmium efflux system protein
MIICLCFDLSRHSLIITVLEYSNCDCLNQDCAEDSQGRGKSRSLWIVIALLSCFLAVEWSVGLWSHSLSLQADAEHVLSDVTALGLTLTASWLTQRPASGRATFGYHRVEVLVALVSGLSLLAIATITLFEALVRWHTSTPVMGLPMLVVAGISLVINALNIKILHQHSHANLSMRAAFLHIIADAASSVGITLAALAVHLLHWMWADVVAGLLVACLVAVSALPLIWESVEVLLEYAPRTVDLVSVESALRNFSGVADVKHLHIWTIGSGQVALSAHLIGESLSMTLSAQDRDRLVKEIESHLYETFDISEVTLQISSRSLVGDLTLHPAFSRGAERST